MKPAENVKLNNVNVRLARKRILLRGVVQGVGFRPFVYRLAHDYCLAGWVLNYPGGVEVEVEGPLPAVDGFVADLSLKAPPLARIEGAVVEEIPARGEEQFEIRDSRFSEGSYPLISPDIATCAECQQELFDPADRRYRYPFINCTNCGPRFTIIESVPYDRSRTTMREFKMCPQCQSEYNDPLNRRFHAQPNACPVCGPRLELVDSSGRRLGPDTEADDVISRAADLLLAGKILAIKGLGGFHLACDATNAEAVALLRDRKRRTDKPLAVMVATMEEIRVHCEVREAEAALLLSSECPIVLLRRRAASQIVPGVAPGNLYLGVMLPYTPLHHVLLRQVGRPLVMTSGNLSEEPIAQDNVEALRRLRGLADYFVVHDRAIYARYDDSVWFVPELSQASSDQKHGPSPQPLRRSRGYAPFPVRLPLALPPVLAVGAELKNTFCLTRERHAFLSQHIGDMENLETLEHFEATVALFEQLFATTPEIVAYDLHPDYLATRHARSRADRDSLTETPVQHHHAHIASCLVDNAWPPDAGPVIGVCFDGTGYGTDDRIWGGEFLIADYQNFTRAAHLQYLPLAGGDAAVRHPCRLATGYLYALFGRAWLEKAVRGLGLANLEALSSEQLSLTCQQVDRQLNAPLTSSVGRLFDAVASLIGIRQHVTYEAQAAIELEMQSLAASERQASPRYPFALTKQDAVGILGLGPLFEAVVDDLRLGRSAAEIGLELHRSIAVMVAVTCGELTRETGLHTVALSGGCFQNRLLLRLTAEALVSKGYHVLTHRQVPCNDGGLSLGQAIIAGLNPGTVVD